MGWDGMGSDGMGWDGMGWDGMGWDWDGMGWDGMGWDGMGWDGMGWDGMGWDGMRTRSRSRRRERRPPGPVQRSVSDPRSLRRLTRMYGQNTSWAELSSMAVRVELTGEWAELCSTCPLEL